MGHTLQLASGQPVSPVLLGTAHVGSPLPDRLTPKLISSQGFQILDAAFDAGCNGLDLAASYMLGGTERLVGHWMSIRKNRERLFLVTKGGHPYPIVAPDRLTPEALTADLHDSLKRLRTDFVDLFLLHRDSAAAPLEAIVETIEAHRREGKLRAWGVSNWTHQRIEQLLELCDRTGRPALTASSPQLALVRWTHPPWKGCVTIAGAEGGEARAFYERTQLPVLAYSPLANGFLSNRPRKPPDRDPLYGTPSNLARRDRAVTFAAERGIGLSEVALAYLFQQPFPVVPIVAVRVSEHMRSCLAAANLTLNKGDALKLEGR